MEVIYIAADKTLTCTHARTHTDTLATRAHARTPSCEVNLQPRCHPDSPWCSCKDEVTAALNAHAKPLVLTGDARKWSPRSFCSKEDGLFLLGFRTIGKEENYCSVPLFLLFQEVRDSKRGIRVRVSLWGMRIVGKRHICKIELTNHIVSDAEVVHSSWWKNC